MLEGKCHEYKYNWWLEFDQICAAARLYSKALVVKFRTNPGHRR